MPRPQRSASLSSSLSFPSSLDTNDADHLSERLALPHVPDLRFEQAYTKSVQVYLTHNDWAGVLLVTIRDQVLMPLLQGALWGLGSVALGAGGLWMRERRRARGGKL